VISDRPDPSAENPLASALGSSFLEDKPAFRADTDQGGSWWVWRRLSVNGWATHHRCGDREAAHSLAAQLNRSADDVA